MKALKIKNKRNSGFTLIELLVVIGILAVLLAIVLIAINPARQFGQANNTKRRSDVSAILNAVGAYAADNAGLLPGTIPTAPAAAAVISTAGIGSAFCNALVPNYIAALPSDPNGGTFGADCDTAFDTKYTIVKDANNRVTVAAPQVELGITGGISATR
jgi:prepilin-type N-terminal cleavage/methylation domain-containing protein